MFQFLIGTVKTELLDKKYQNFYMFQFLIGTVKTLSRYSEYCDDIGFNSS